MQNGIYYVRAFDGKKILSHSPYFYTFERAKQTMNQLKNLDKNKKIEEKKKDNTDAMVDTHREMQDVHREERSRVDETNFLEHFSE